MELDLERIAKEKGVVKEQGGEANIKNCFRICMYTGTRTPAFSNHCSLAGICCNHSTNDLQLEDNAEWTMAD